MLGSAGENRLNAVKKAPNRDYRITTIPEREEENGNNSMETNKKR